VATAREDREGSRQANLGEGSSSAIVRKLRWRCMAFALLTSHYHLVLEVEENRLQPGMKWLNGTRRQRTRAFRYVALDPVRAGLVERPDDWVWSSYAGTAGYANRSRSSTTDRYASASEPAPTASNSSARSSRRPSTP
jgi:hypothetical protein